MDAHQYWLNHVPFLGEERKRSARAEVSQFEPNSTLAIAQGQRPMLDMSRRIYRSREAVLTDNRVETALAAIPCG